MTPGSKDLLAEGREAICTALTALADAEAKPRLAALLRDLKDEVEQTRDASSMRPARANYVFRRVDDYWRRRWDAISENPGPYEQHVNGIAAMYWARRTAFEWRWPGKWSVSHTV